MLLLKLMDIMLFTIATGTTLIDKHHSDDNAPFHISILFFRAAAHNKMNNNEQALQDCFRSIEIDPNYSKAYGRLG